MASSNIKPEQLANEVIKQLNRYSEEVSEGIEKASKDVSNYGTKLLKTTTFPQPSSTGDSFPSTRRRWKNYASSWKVTNTSKKAKGFIRNTIHNEKHYRLTHLLEYGHATRNGKRTRAFEHIKPIEEELIKEYENEVEEIIKKGGK